jgi:hypothetical protein
VSKRAGNLYRGGRVKCLAKDEVHDGERVVVVGMQANPGGAPFALLDMIAWSLPA